MDRIATFHVVRERPRRQIVVLARMLTDRWRLRRVDGLAFARVLGTGRGADTGPSADLRRQAYFLVWDDADAARSFVSEHPVAHRWRGLDVEHDLVLALAAGHGTWGDRPILDGMRRVQPDGPTATDVVVLTRARIRVRHWAAFRRASRATAHAAPDGRRWAIGIGELPIGLLGTVSGWRSAADVDAWIAADATHARAASHAGRWFAESLFARFVPIDLDVARST